MQNKETLQEDMGKKARQNTPGGVKGSQQGEMEALDFNHLRAEAGKYAKNTHRPPGFLFGYIGKTICNRFMGVWGNGLGEALMEDGIMFPQTLISS